MTPELQAAVLEAAEDAVRHARNGGTLADGDVIGAAHSAALAAGDVVLRWVRGHVDRQLNAIY